MSIQLRCLLAAVFLCVCSLLVPSVAMSQGGQEAMLSEKRSSKDLYAMVKPSTADLPTMLEKRQIRVLIAPSRTNFFIGPNGEYRGLEYQLLQTYEHLINNKLKRSANVKLTFIPVFFDDLIPSLLAGKGDIAAGGMTITPDREEMVAFTAPYIDDVNEILVTRKGVAQPAKLEDLSGLEVHVLRGSSYVQHLAAINRDLATKGISPIRVVEADKTMQTENLLEMLNAGIIDRVVTDDHLALNWSRIFHNIVVHDEIVFNRGGRIAWAVRKDNTKLLASLNDAIGDILKQDAQNFSRKLSAFYASTHWFENPFQSSTVKRLIPHFQTFADKYYFDWLQSLAQGFQESNLDNSARGAGGGIGIMQVQPATAMSLGLRHLEDPAVNIHAGIRYMGVLRDQYFADPKLSPEERLSFVLAAYNAGPNRVLRLQQDAAKAGLDPNKWLGNVERIALKKIGQETVTYVRNILNYYLAYRLSMDIMERQKAAQQQQPKVEEVSSPGTGVD